MSTRKTTLFYALLIAVSSLAVGMVIASRLDLTPASSAQTLAVPPMNSAPVTGPLDAQTFRNVAKAQQPMVVNIRTEIEGAQPGPVGLLRRRRRRRRRRRLLPPLLRQPGDRGDDDQGDAAPQRPRQRQRPPRRASRRRSPPAPGSSSARTG